MMGQHDRSEALFYYFRLEDQIPENHLLQQYVRIAPSGRQHFPLHVGATLSEFAEIAEHYPVYRIDPP